MTTDPSNRLIVLGQPGYGTITAGAAQGFWRATRLPDSQVLRPYQESSLLANNFNSLWCEAMNHAHRGRPVTHFAMIHADVEPAIYWLDTLIDEMEAHDLDVLSVAIPIKDMQGLTSTALARPDGDTWRPLCRLTLEEVHRLPETFTAEDTGYPLLLNTGLWVCRFDMRWAPKVHFTINDRIAFDTKLNRYVEQVEPEDWWFSRICHELGLKLGCTRKVPVGHKGTMTFGNDRPWGQPFDAAWTDKSQLPASVPEAFVMPEGIDGWLSREEGKALADLARGQRVLEIGSYCGLSTVCMARTAKHVTSVDPHDGRATPKAGWTGDLFRDNLRRYGVVHKVKALLGTSSEVLPGRSDRFDLIFIDGAHDHESVQTDITLALGLLAPGGLLAFHDYRTFPGEHDGRWDPGVTDAVNELVEDGGSILSTHDSLAVVRPPAVVPLSLEA